MNKFKIPVQFEQQTVLEVPGNNLKEALSFTKTEEFIKVMEDTSGCIKGSVMVMDDEEYLKDLNKDLPSYKNLELYVSESEMELVLNFLDSNLITYRKTEYAYKEWLRDEVCTVIENPDDNLNNMLNEVEKLTGTINMTVTLSDIIDEVVSLLMEDNTITDEERISGIVYGSLQRFIPNYIRELKDSEEQE